MPDYKAQLLELKAEYENRIVGTELHLTGKNGPLSQDFAEQAVELENEEVIEQLDNEAKQELALVNKALNKIDAGIYGACDECGESISEARLSALPQAEHCIKCAD